MARGSAERRRAAPQSVALPLDFHEQALVGRDSVEPPREAKPRSRQIAIERWDHF